MPDSFDSITSIDVLFNPNDYAKDKDKFILNVLKQIHITGIEHTKLLRKEMLSNFKATNDKIEMIQKACPWRNGECHDLMDKKIGDAVNPIKKEIKTSADDSFTKSQGKMYLYLVLAWSLVIGLINKPELLTFVIKKVIP